MHSIILIIYKWKQNHRNLNQRESNRRLNFNKLCPLQLKIYRKKTSHKNKKLRKAKNLIKSQNKSIKINWMPTIRNRIKDFPSANLPQIHIKYKLCNNNNNSNKHSINNKINNLQNSNHHLVNRNNLGIKMPMSHT